jgi:excisionase family DNA binding protein
MQEPSDALDPPAARRPNRLLTVEQLAGYLAVPVAWVRKGVLERTLPYTKIGKNVRFTPSQVEQILADGERPSLHAADSRPRGRGSARTRL